jgi:hypothetical protein
VALTYATAIDDPARFTSSKTVGAYFGLTPTRYQSGETDRVGQISKIGDSSVRATLYESAHIIITRPVKGCTALKGGRCGSLNPDKKNGEPRHICWDRAATNVSARAFEAARLDGERVVVGLDLARSVFQVQGVEAVQAWRAYADGGEEVKALAARLPP